MELKKIAIIGGGNLGSAIAEGLLRSNAINATDLTVTRRNVQLLASLQSKGVNTLSDNKKAVKDADVIFLVVKPYAAPAILKEIKSSLNSEKILVSFVAGMTLETLEATVGSSIAVFRAMPNTAIAICESITCLAFNNKWGALGETMIKLFDLLGKTVVIDEGLMSAATVLGGCGIAYALRFLRAATEGGVEIGFKAGMAQTIAAQIMKGACELIIQLGSHPEQEIDKVTTPKGITIAGLNEMEHEGFSSSVIQGIVSSFEKTQAGK